MATYYVQTDGDNGNAGTSTGSGNAWADPGYAASQMGEGDICYVKTGTYTMTTSTPGAGGPAHFATADVRCAMIGYESTPGDDCPNDSFPELNAGTVTFGSVTALFKGNGADNEKQVFMNLTANGNSQSNTRGFQGDASSNVYATRCVAVTCAEAGFYTIGCTSCFADTCSTIGFRTTVCAQCTAKTCGKGFVGVNDIVMQCIAYNCTDDGFGTDTTIDAYRTVYDSCTSFGNGGDGFSERLVNISGMRCTNCISVGNGGYGFHNIDSACFVNCATYNNTSGRTSTTPLVDSLAITLSGDPFVDSANGDFRLNNTAGAGALLRGLSTGIPGQVATRDIGAVQHSDPTAGGGGGAILLGSSGRFGVHEV